MSAIGRKLTKVANEKVHEHDVDLVCVWDVGANKVAAVSVSGSNSRNVPSVWDGNVLDVVAYAWASVLGHVAESASTAG